MDPKTTAVLMTKATLYVAFGAAIIGHSRAMRVAKEAQKENAKFEKKVVTGTVVSHPLD